MNFLNTDFSGNAATSEKQDAASKHEVEELRDFYLSYRPVVHSSVVSASKERAVEPEASDTGKAGRLGTLALHTLILAERSFKNYARNLLAYGVRAAMYGGMGLMLATIWIRLGRSDSIINDRLSVHFYSVAFLAFMSVAGIPEFLEERAVYYRESKNGLYDTLPFVLANTLVNIPFLFFCTVFFTVICYWAIGLNPGAGAFFRFLGFLYLAIFAAESQVVVVASLLPIFVAALAITAFLNGFWMSVGGYFIKARSLPRFWFYSFHFMDYQKYAFELLTNSDLRGVTFTCDTVVNGSCACAYPSSTPDTCTVSGDDVLRAQAAHKKELGNGSIQAYLHTKEDPRKNAIIVSGFRTQLVPKPPRRTMEYPSVKEENKVVHDSLALYEDYVSDWRLSPHEEMWVSLYPFLFSRGYKLRPRYHPEWVPSWISDPGGLTAFYREDGIPSRPEVVDAVRGDGSKVMLKRVSLDREELNIALYTSSPPRSDDPRNCCVPILDVVLLPACETHAVIVMPLLYQHVFLPFRRVGELLEMGRQLSKCLEFLHEHRIAHRDFCFYNIMIDPTRLLPKGFHPFGPLIPPDGRHDMIDRFKWKSRWSVRPNRYYVIDFGLSLKLEEGWLALGDVGQDRSVPEMSDTVPYDPFPADVYQFGNVLLRIYKDYCPNEEMDKLTLLAKRITDTDPLLRPTAKEVAQEFDRLSREIGYFGRRKWIWPSDFPYTFWKKFKVVLGHSAYPP
ncbi:hypothetical protein NMY22_g4173 [Coprinellus aureogranulatus]|nr:hypothetical protein NMY22_g4173 [Coprinellus aureogranulatus]